MAGKVKAGLGRRDWGPQSLQQGTFEGGAREGSEGRARGLVVMTGVSHTPGRRFESGRAHPKPLSRSLREREPTTGAGRPHPHASPISHLNVTPTTTQIHPLDSLQ